MVGSHKVDINEKRRERYGKDKVKSNEKWREKYHKLSRKEKNVINEKRREYYKNSPQAEEGNKKRRQRYDNSKEQLNNKRRDRYKSQTRQREQPFPYQNLKHIVNSNIDFLKAKDNKDDINYSFLKATFQFESKMLNCHHSYCRICHQRRLRISTINSVCQRCLRSERKLFTIENKALPVWYQNNKAMFHIPDELKDLTIAEKLLIQRVSPLIPVIHIKNGNLGCRGHIVSFFQDISSVTLTLP